MNVSSEMARGQNVTTASASSRLLLPLWLAVFAVFFFVCTLSIPSDTQFIFSSALLLLLFFCYQLTQYRRSARRSTSIRLIIIFVCTFLTVRYIHWRATDSMPTQFGIASMICGLLLFLAELQTILAALIGYFINARPNHRRTLQLPKDQSVRPTVDVYIPTYNEDPDILRTTVIAATQMNYPADKLRVYILDDGGTAQKLEDANPDKARAAAERAAELQAIARRYGAHYLTREKNVHAKAGNLNSALQHTSGELLVILDCDHIPTADFVERLVGFFLESPELFVVQTPHNFVSPDPLERNLDTYQLSPAENELFYDVMQPGLDSWGTSFFCGSAAMLRRSVIDRLGGISGQTITEDAETTLDALAMGYTSAYYGRPMVSGLQPETYSGLVVQRVRWAQGMWQIFMLKNPWRIKNLNLMNRILYTNFAFHWGFAFSRMIMLLAPPAFLIFGINLCDTTSQELFSYAVPALISSMIATQYFYGRVRWPFISQLYEVLQSVYLSAGLIEVVRRPRSPSFKVTPKGELLDRQFVSTMSVPFYFILGLNALALALGVAKLSSAEWSNSAVSFVMFWAVLDMILLLAALGVLFERRQLRGEPRVVMLEKVQLLVDQQREYEALAVDASANGMGITLTIPGIKVRDLPAGSVVQINCPASGARFQARLVYCYAIAPGTFRAGCRYEFSSVAEERNAIRLAFGSSERLIRNNERRHKGRSIVMSLFTLLSFALTRGREHLHFWLVARVSHASRLFKSLRKDIRESS